MTTFDDLRVLYARKLEADDKFKHENTDFAVAVVEGLHEHLQIPRTWTDREGNTQRYLRTYEADEHFDGGVDHSEDQSLWRITTHSYDGKFEFGMGVILEEDGGLGRKTELVFPVKCMRHDESVTVTVHDSSVTCPFLPGSYIDASPAHQLIEQSILNWLERRFADGRGPQRIGFQINGRT